MTIAAGERTSLAGTAKQVERAIFSMGALDGCGGWIPPGGTSDPAERDYEPNGKLAELLGVQPRQLKKSLARLLALQQQLAATGGIKVLIPLHMD